MRARDQSSIFSTGRKFCPDYGILLELHTLTLVARSYALLPTYITRCGWKEWREANKECPALSSLLLIQQIIVGLQTVSETLR